MEEYQYLLDKYYGSPTWEVATRLTFQTNMEMARNFLERHWIPESEYNYYWDAIKRKIFILDAGLNEYLFADGYELIAMMGGNLFTESNFNALMQCFLAIGDKYFVIIEDSIGKDSPIKLKFPTDITWEQFRSGDFITTAIVDLPHRCYFVFTESTNCAKYVSSNAPSPLHLMGFKKEYEALFREKFSVSEEDWKELYDDWLPEHYEGKIINNSL